MTLRSVPYSPSTLRRQPPHPSLTTPVQYLKGVGPHKALLLEKLGIKTVENLLFHFPRDHQDWRPLPIREAKEGKKNAFLGKIISVDYRQVGRMLGQYTIALRDKSGICKAIWFKHLSYQYDVFGTLRKNIIPEKTICVFGIVEKGTAGPILRVEDYELVESTKADPSNESSLVPVYPLTEGIQDRWLRILQKSIVPLASFAIKDPLPDSLKEKAGLLPFDEAVRLYHFPPNWSDRQRARTRLAFDEFFFLELALALNRQSRESSAKGFSSSPTKKLLTPFKNQLNYEFTRAQIRCINEIFHDMAHPVPMNRLLQGDVGSGKTVVALSAALLSIENGRQVAILAPTEILAEQHAITIGKFLEGLSVKTALLTGSFTKKARVKILEECADGKIQLLIGTHAILNEDVKFKELGLVIIDEQHRFGVRQRASLVNKSQDPLLEKFHPDVLILTATPIPRTLAMTLYGDLDVSTLDEMPPGRTPVGTRMALQGEGLNIIEESLHRGDQGYLVFAVINESEKPLKKEGQSLKSAKQEFEKLKARFPRHRLGLLHGEMDSPAKRSMMDEFRQGKIDLLCATPVIEVGIDVTNATMMGIFNPERFGLAQLHQLRGRVGRGEKKSECLLLMESPEHLINERLQAFCDILDGFKLAEEDLKWRGPGEILGESQHGIPFFKVANLLDDALLLAQARELALQLVNGKISLTMNEFHRLNQELFNRFGKNLPLSKIG